MTDAEHTLIEARDAARTSRSRLIASATETRQRLLPARLWADAKDNAREQARDAGRTLVDHGRRHPLMIGAAITGLALWAFRRPLLARGPGALQSLYGWMAGNLSFREVMQRASAQATPAPMTPADDNDQIAEDSPPS